MTTEQEKKFDIILSNPPYNRNLHLKFLEKYIQLADKVISIQPVRWLQDPFAMDKRSTLKQYENVAKEINNIDVISNNNYSSDKLFDIIIYSDLAIYTINNTDSNKIDYINFWKKSRNNIEVSIIEKVCYSDKCEYLSNVIEKNKRDGIRVLIGLFAGNRGNLPVYKDIVYTVDGFVNDKDWTKCKNMGGYEKPENSPLPNSILFNTEKEAENFWKSYKNLKFFKVICDITIQQQNLQESKLPFLNDYTHEITDNEMFDLFKLTDKEIEYIKDFEEKRRK